MISLLITIGSFAVLRMILEMYKKAHKHEPAESIWMVGCLILATAFAPLCIFTLFESLPYNTWTTLSSDKWSIEHEYIIAKQNNTVSKELIDKIENHNNKCDEFYNTWQSSRKYSLFAKNRKPALEYKLIVPSH